MEIIISITVNVLLLGYILYNKFKPKKPKILFNQDRFNLIFKTIEHYENTIFSMLFSKNIIFSLIKKDIPNDSELIDIKKRYIKTFFEYVPKEILSEMLFYFNNSNTNLINYLLDRLQLRLQNDIFNNIGDRATKENLVKGI